MSLLDTNVVSTFLAADGQRKFPKLVAEVTRLRAAESLAVSVVTVYELRRGFEKLVRQGGDRLREGRKKLVAMAKFIEQVQVLGLGDHDVSGWEMAAGFWADAQVLKPAMTISDADLLIATTAALHGHAFITSDRKLVDVLDRISFPTEATLLAVE